MSPNTRIINPTHLTVAHITPAVTINYQNFAFENANVVVAHVAPLSIHDRPAYVDGRAYLRQADGNYAMAAQLGPRLLAEYIKNVRATGYRLANDSDESILRLTGAVSATTGELTSAGL